MNRLHHQPTPCRVCRQAGAVEQVLIDGAWVRLCHPCAVWVWRRLDHHRAWVAARAGRPTRRPALPRWVEPACEAAP